MTHSNVLISRVHGSLSAVLIVGLTSAEIIDSEVLNESIITAKKGSIELQFRAARRYEKFTLTDIDMEFIICCF